MQKIRKKDNVVRISHGKDIIFEVKNILSLKNGEKIAILKGITERIEVDSKLEDLELVKQDIVENNLRSLDIKLEKRIEEQKKKLNNIQTETRLANDMISGKVLHLDRRSKI